LRELAAGMSEWRGAMRPITVAAGPFTIVDQDVTAARAAAAACTAAYLGAMGDIYPRVVAEQGLATEVELVRATRTVPSEAENLLDEFTAHGTPEMVQEQLRRGTRSSTSPWSACRRVCHGLSWKPPSARPRRPTFGNHHVGRRRSAIPWW
jgi:alkanesulfonate monooxygenase SsuD/methylene tetrahydromethanopterin reductase-like flavin-dependent oxidoreductase (luciferase family)